MMTGVHHSPPGTQVDSDCVPEDALGNWEGSQIILEVAPPDVAHAISKFFDNAAGSHLFPRNGRIQSESESDSGDSVFLTQVPTPEVEKAHLQQRRPRAEQDALGLVTSILQIQSARSAQKRPKYVKKKSKSKFQPIKKRRMRWYSFDFLRWIYNKKSRSRSKQKRTLKTTLRAYYNAKLHSSVIGGFLKCVKTHQITTNHGKSRDTQASPLPGRYIDEGVTLSPLSEEDEISDDCDIKVVKLNRFATSSKPRLKKTNPPSQRAPQRRGNATNVNADITLETPEPSQVQSSADPLPSQSHDAMKLCGKRRSDSLSRNDTAAQEEMSVDFSQCETVVTTQGGDSQLKKKRKRKKENRDLELQLSGHLEESINIHSDDASTLMDNTGLSRTQKKKRRTSEMCTAGQIKETDDSQKCTDGSQKVTECSSVQHVEVTTKKKKNKRMSEASTTDLADCGDVQNKHSASVEKRGTNGTASFLFGDTVEKDDDAREETTVSFPAKKKKNKQKCKYRPGPSTSGFDMEVVENIDDSQKAVVASNDIALKKKKKKALLSSTGLALEESFVIDSEEEFKVHNKHPRSSVSETKSLNETGLTFKKKKKRKKKDN